MGRNLGRKGLRFVFSASFFITLLSARLVLGQVDVSNNNGDLSDGSLGAAITFLNNQIPPGGSVSFEQSLGTITLSQSITATGSVTFLSTNAPSAQVLGQDNLTSQFQFQQDLNVGSNFALSLGNNASNVNELDASVTAGTWTLNSGSQFSLLAGTAAVTTDAGTSAVTGISGGNVSVSAGSITMNSIAGGSITGGNGQSISVTGSDIDSGGMGGNASLNANNLYSASSAFTVTGGTGGTANGAGVTIGSQTSVSIGSGILNSGSTFVIQGGNGGSSDSGNAGGYGGSANFTAGGTLAISGSNLSVLGGKGSDSSNEDAGAGGGVSATLGALNMDSGASAAFTGGNGGTGYGAGGIGGEIDLTANSVSLTGSGTSLNINGGVGGQQTGSQRSDLGGDGGSAFVTVGSLFVDSGTIININGGAAGNTSGPSIGGGGNFGVTNFSVASISAGTVTLNGDMGVTGGAGGSGFFGGNGGYAIAAASTWVLGSDASLSVIGGVAGEGASTVGPGGEAIMTAGTLSMDSGSSIEVHGGAGGAGTGHQGVTVGGLGGLTTFTAGSVSMGTGTSIGVMGGTGGTGGGQGGQVGVSIVSLSMDSGSNARFAGGSAVDGTGMGGQVSLSAGAVTMNSSSISILAGNGGSGGGDGNQAIINLDSLAMNGASTFTVEGGQGGAGTTQGGNGGMVQMYASSVSMTSGSDFTALGGDASNGGQAGNLNVIFDDLQGASGSSVSLFGTGQSTLIVNGGNFAGSIQGSALLEVGGSPLTLSGSNSYSGGTSVIGGQLVVDTGGTLGSGSVFTDATVDFIDNAQAGSNTFTTGNSGSLDFRGTSSASNATIINNDYLQFYDTANAGSAAITNLGHLNFYDGSSAANAVIQNQSNGIIVFSGDNSPASISTAGNSNITNNGAVSFSDSSTAGSATIISNSGATVAFSGTSTGGSAFFVNSGGSVFDISGVTSSGVTVDMVEGAGNIGLGSKNLTTGDNTLNATISGVISDTGIVSATGGSLTKTGAATLTLAGANTYSGGTSVAAGTLALAGTGTLGSGSLGINESANFDLSGSTAGVTVGSIQGSGGISLGGNTLTVGSDNISTTFSGVIGDGGIDGGSGGGLTKVGTGTLTLMETDTYSGSTVLSAGTLAVGNSDALGTGSVAVNGGTLAVSGGPMTIDVGGNYTQGSNGHLQLGLAGASTGQYDILDVSGAATLNGALAVTSYGGFIPAIGNDFMAVTANGGISGKFSSFTSDITGIRFYPIYQNDDLLLEVFPASFAQLGTTPNQTAVGKALDAGFYVSGNQSLVQILGTQNASQLVKDFDLISPAGLTPIYKMGFATEENRASIALNRLDALFQQSPKAGGADSANILPEGPLFAGNMKADKEKAIMDQEEAKGDTSASPNTAAPENRIGVFVNGLGNFGSVTGDSNASGYNFMTAGMAAGMDYRFNQEWAGGLLLGYSSSGTSQSGSNSVSVTGGQAGLYGGWNHGKLRLEALVDGGINSYQTQRASFDPLLSGATALGSTQGTQFGSQLTCGINRQLGQVGLDMFITGQYADVSINGFKETGSLTPLGIPSQSESELSSQLGAKADWSWKMGNISILPNISLAWEHVYQGNQDSLNATLGSANNPFTVQGPLTGTDAAVLGAGINAQFSPSLGAYVQYQGKLGLTNYGLQNINAGVGIEF